MSEPITKEQLEVMKRGASHEVALLIAEVERLRAHQAAWTTSCDIIGDEYNKVAVERDALRARVEELETRRQNAMHCLRELQYNHHLGPCDCYACLGLSAALGKEE